MDPRKQRILQAIVEQFIQSASPVGSKLLYEEYDFDVSPATIRNEMAALEREGFIAQPHTSAGRVPTSLAYRLFVDRMKLNLQVMQQAKQDIELAKREFYLNKAKEKLHELVSILASVTSNVCFATLPENRRLFYMGISNVLRQPEFLSNPAAATKVVEVLEHQFAELLDSLEIGVEPQFYIGKENLIPQIQSCSLLVQRYEYRGFSGVIGVLGSVRMNYAYNLAALKSAVDLLD